MRLNKKIVLSLSFIFLCQPLMPARDMDDDFFENAEVLNYVDTHEFTINRAASPDKIVCLLAELGGIGLLQEDLFIFSYPLNPRSLLDYPEFLPQRLYVFDWTIGTHFFYNQTTRMRFHNESTAISSYLDFCAPTLLDKLDALSDQVESIFPNLNLTQVNALPLFRDFTAQERRAGMMFELARQFGPFTIRSYTPLYYLIRNFFATDKELDRIESALGKNAEEDSMQFARKFLIADKLGFGDTRLNLDFEYYVGDNVISRVGILFTVPTAFVIAQPLYGNEFCRHVGRPAFSFEQLFDLGQGTPEQKKEALKIVENFSLGILEELSANLLETPLGNGKHFGMGIYLDAITQLKLFIKRPWALRYSIRTRYSIEYQLPHTMCRDFIEQTDPAAFEALGLFEPTTAICDRATDDPAYAQEVLSFLEGRFVDKFYPFVFKTKVQPGFILRSTTRYYYERERGGFFFGSDMWLQTREKLSHIKIVRVNPERPAIIEVDKANRPLTYQAKLIANGFLKVERDTHDWTLGVTLDGTYWGHNIGDDFMLSFNVEINF